jgi:acetolactate synthase-1/2/3 large subunit
MWVHKALAPFLEPDDVLVFDGGDFCHFARAYLPAKSPRAWWYLPGLGMLGSGVPTALAAKVAHPDRRVICLTGDGSFGFNGMELDTAVRHNLNVTVILGNDAAWGIDRQIQLGVFGRPVATDLLPSRYDKMMEGFGGHAEHVTDPSEVPGAIERALSSDQASLLNIAVERAISPRAQAAIDRWNSEIVQPF